MLSVYSHSGLKKKYLEEKFYEARISELEGNFEIHRSVSLIYQMRKLRARKLTVVSPAYLTI